MLLLCSYVMSAVRRYYSSQTIIGIFLGFAYCSLILLISIVCIGLRLTNVIIVHLTPQLAAYSGQQYFEALLRRSSMPLSWSLSRTYTGKKRFLKIYYDDVSTLASSVLYYQ